MKWVILFLSTLLNRQILFRNSLQLIFSTDSDETSGSKTVENVEVHQQLTASLESLSKAVGSCPNAERKDSVSSDDKIFLDTRWTQSKTATLKKNFSEDSGVSVYPEASPPADAAGSKSQTSVFKLPPEDTVVTLLHQSHLDSSELKSDSCVPPSTYPKSTKYVKFLWREISYCSVFQRHSSSVCRCSTFSFGSRLQTKAQSNCVIFRGD